MSIEVEILKMRVTKRDLVYPVSLVGYHGEVESMVALAEEDEYVMFPDSQQPDKVIYFIKASNWGKGRGYGYVCFIKDSAPNKLFQAPVTLPDLPKEREKVDWAFKVAYTIDMSNADQYLVVSWKFMDFPTIEGQQLSGGKTLAYKLYSDIIVRGEWKLTHPWVVALAYFFPYVLGLQEATKGELKRGE